MSGIGRDEAFCASPLDFPGDGGGGVLWEEGAFEALY